MQVMQEQFRMWVGWILETGKEVRGKEHQLWTVPALVCAMRYIYFRGDATEETE